ncbi:hypothetical protein D7B24_003567 [Verticillium nonalfalfae]|uniref:Uncharacterized protein n=1 Tax=Verticillium nonalfalfae TaxID=1051616 RepID=A0A3M9YFS2_9PEZI|nr:uncharacterized protein D7B24_003567 [Verticillium nonalfalfae]RNJ59015.1 hypothetical protein D7B24_003567 [Verticillium nonalfalfae]
MAPISAAPSMRVSGEGYGSEGATSRIRRKKLTSSSPQVQGTSHALERYRTDPSPGVAERLLARAANGRDSGSGSEAANKGLQELEAMMKRTTRAVTPRS